MQPTAEPGSSSVSADRPRDFGGNWSSLFQHSAAPVFLLSRRRQIRYVNHAWESLTGKSLDAVRGMFCLPRKKKGTQPQRALLQAMAPTPEVMVGRIITVRRPAPPARLGPPWWEVTFIPIGDDDGLINVLGFVHVVAQTVPAPPTGVQSEALAALRLKTAAQYSFDLLHSDSPKMQRVEAQARLAAQTKAPVWIVGEPGTGKETLARIIHFQGITRERTFLMVDCAGLQPHLVRSMLFGHVGQAGPLLGAICLKEPASLARDLQEELLEWIEEQEDPPRIICVSRPAETRPMDEFQAALNVLEIQLPPLRERTDDIAALTRLILHQHGDSKSAVAPPAPEFFERLQRHAWPGNLRELTQIIRESMAMAGGKRLEPNHLPLEFRAPFASPAEKPLPTLDELLEQIERKMIVLALKKAKGNRSEAADRLGIPRPRLIRRIEALKLES